VSLFAVAHWIQELPVSTAVREAGVLYPILMTTHLASIALFGGAILMTDLRLLGIAMTSQPVSEVIRQFRIYKRIGLLIMLSCGILLGAAKAELYFSNPYFRAKLFLLGLLGIHALFFRRRIYGNESANGRSAVIGRRAKTAACLSLTLWLGVLCCGRLIAYYDAPEAGILDLKH
jgi:hypothetical protein